MVSNGSKCMVKLDVPFISEELANVAKNSIDADEVPNPDLISRSISVSGKKLSVTIECEDLFKLRTSLNNYIEAVLQVEKTIGKFNFDNYGVHQLPHFDHERRGDSTKEVREA